VNAVSYIRFVPGPAKPKTLTWKVVTANLFAAELGEVGWFARWRQYAFSPKAGTVFNKDCLREIADFCDQRTTEHRKTTGRLFSRLWLTP